MYHGHFKGTYFEAGYKWGEILYNHGKRLDFCPTFKLTEDKYAFAAECKKEYSIYYPEIIEEIKGIAEGNRVPQKTIETVLFSMYCFELDNKCTCFAFKNENEVIFGRNSDFLVSLEKLYMNCIYKLKNAYSFNGDTTAYAEMENGVNERGFAAGLTFVYPKIRKPGINAGMLIRYLLEKCSTVKEALCEIKRLPIASAETVTLADKTGNLAVAEINPENKVVIYPEGNQTFVAAANKFNSPSMTKHNNENIDDWRAEERLATAINALKNNAEKYSVKLAEDILGGKYGFMCQYDRKTNADTVWSVIYDLKRKQIYRVEGNPSRKKFNEDLRFKIQ